MPQPMNMYALTLVLTDVNEITPELADALFSAIDGAIELDCRMGVVMLEVQRTADTEAEAIDATLREIEALRMDVSELRVESV